MQHAARVLFCNKYRNTVRVSNTPQLRVPSSGALLVGGAFEPEAYRTRSAFLQISPNDTFAGFSDIHS